MWCKYFMEAQGYTIENNILYQDNKSTILLAKNGRMSAGKNSKHIKNRFFLITDKVAQDDLKIEHMGTDDMWGDVNTKPTQGKRFRIMRAEVMGVSIDYDDDDKRMRTHPLLMPKLESERISIADGEVPKKAAVVIPVKTPPNVPKGERTKVLPGGRFRLIPIAPSVFSSYGYLGGALTRMTTAAFLRTSPSAIEILSDSIFGIKSG